MAEPARGAAHGERRGRRTLEVSERAFKRIAFWSTLAGLIMMAAGLRAALFDGDVVLFALLFVGGAVVASTSVFVRPRPEPGFVVELFTREGCSLCEEAQAWLSAKSAEYDFALWEQDVDEDPELAREYGDWVPVAVLARDADAPRRTPRRSRGRELAKREELFRLSPDYPALERRFRKLSDARVRGR